MVWKTVRKKNCPYWKQIPMFQKDKLNWADARDSCSSEGLMLATVADQPNEVLTYINANDIYDEKSFWVGGSDIAVEGKWIWTDGRPFDDSFPWRYGEPNNAFADTHGEDCIYASDAYYDWGCHHEIKYICELAKPY
ncbi:unnamed protein product [Meganyctiphanes norvegica]|uniref:C-type lectin domain-containing protein n=1 Tax=Meganyctiphanes norvegica TaxID=48144 RepID=A0AAV2RFV4_MEGNR